MSLLLAMLMEAHGSIPAEDLTSAWTYAPRKL